MVEATSPAEARSPASGDQPDTAAIQPDRSPASGQRAEVNEVETRSLAMRPQPLDRGLGWDRGIQGLGTGEGKDGVIQVWTAAAIGGCAKGRELSCVKRAHQIRGLTQQPGGESGDLKKLET